MLKNDSEQYENIIKDYIAPLVKSVYKSKMGGWVLIFNDNLIILNYECSIIYEISIINTNIIFCCPIDELENTSNYDQDFYHMNFIIEKYKQYKSYNNQIDSLPDITSDSAFEDYLKIKSKEGKKAYVVDCVYIPIFYGLLPMNKSDSLDIAIYSIPKSNDKMVKYIIHKKKNKVDINIYTRILGILDGNG